MTLDTAQPPSAATGPPAARGPRGFSIRGRTGRWRDALRRRFLAAADIAAVLAAAALTGVLADHAEIVLASLPAQVLLAKLYGLYDRDHRRMRHLTSDELADIIAWAATGTLMVVALVAVFDNSDDPAAAAVGLAVATALLCAPLRALARGVWRASVPPERVLIVGSGAAAQATRRKLELFGDMHMQLVGVADPAPFAGSVDAARVGLRAVRADTGLERLVLASDALDDRLVSTLVTACRSEVVKLGFVPPAAAAFASTVQLAHVAELPVVDCVTWDPSRSTLLLKRALDVTLALVVLILAAPAMALIALAIALESGRPVLFAQRRGGVAGRAFRMLKFRTMQIGAEERLADIVALDELDGPSFKLRDDPRVTRVGRWLRRTSLDELPQLLNVLRGDMSLVGPRPEQLDLVDRYADEHRFRLSIKPGLTGPMQISGRGDLAFAERLAVERDYVENLSVTRDLRILIMTVGVVVSGRGAY